MSISAIKPGWWQEPLHKEEKIWIWVAFVWCILITLIMPWWHIYGNQNPSQEYYKITTEAFDQLTDQFIEKNQVKKDGVLVEDEGLPVVQPLANSDIFLRGEQWQWTPVLKLKSGSTYRLHLSSIDVLHGLSIYPIVMNFEAVPGYDYVLTITPGKPGVYNIICNEFCGLGHHAMSGKIIVE